MSKVYYVHINSAGNEHAKCLDAGKGAHTSKCPSCKRDVVWTETQQKCPLIRLKR